jgi:hypothetical protein
VDRLVSELVDDANELVGAAEDLTLNEKLYLSTIGETKYENPNGAGATAVPTAGHSRSPAAAISAIRSVS